MTKAKNTNGATKRKASGEAPRVTVSPTGRIFATAHDSLNVVAATGGASREELDDARTILRMLRASFDDGPTAERARELRRSFAKQARAALNPTFPDVIDKDPKRPHVFPVFGAEPDESARVTAEMVAPMIPDGMLKEGERCDREIASMVVRLLGQCGVPTSPIVQHFRGRIASVDADVERVANAYEMLDARNARDRRRLIETALRVCEYAAWRNVFKRRD